MGVIEEEQPARVRPVLRVSALAAVATLVGAVAIVVLSRATGSQDVGQVAAFVGIALVLAGHLWAARGQSLVALVVTALPGLPLLLLPPGALETGPEAWLVWFFVGFVVLAAFGTVALTTWVGNRWGHHDGGSIDSFFGWFD